MPNHTANLLEIKGSRELVQNVIALCTGEIEDGKPRYMDFKKIIPMPDTLSVTSGGATDMGIAVLQFRKNKETTELRKWMGYPWVVSEGVTTYPALADLLVTKGADLVAGQMALDNIEKYGCPTWYEWSIKYWGTKWNAYDIGSWTVGVNNAEIYFETAWSPPLPVIKVLSLMFPSLTFKITYADEGGGFLGYTTFKVGEGKEKQYTWYKNGKKCLSSSGRELLRKLGRS